MHLKIEYSKRAQTLDTIDFLSFTVYYKHINLEIIN